MISRNCVIGGFVFFGNYSKSKGFRALKLCCVWHNSTILNISKWFMDTVSLFLSRDMTVLKSRLGVSPWARSTFNNCVNSWFVVRIVSWTTYSRQNFWTFECKLKFHVLLEYSENTRWAHRRPPLPGHPLFSIWGDTFFQICVIWSKFVKSRNRSVHSNIVIRYDISNATLDGGSIKSITANSGSICRTYT